MIQAYESFVITHYDFISTTVYSKLPLNSMQSNGLLSLQFKSAIKNATNATQTLIDAMQTVNHATQAITSITPY